MLGVPLLSLERDLEASNSNLHKRGLRPVEASPTLNSLPVGLEGFTGEGLGEVVSIHLG